MALTRIMLLWLSALAACLAVAAAWTDGSASFTGEDAAASSIGAGACGYGALTAAQYPGLALVGISQSKNAIGSKASKGCGTCLEVKCTDKEACRDASSTITVMVHDNCEKCGPTQLNLAATPFAKLASLDVGRITVQYREVPCSFSGGVTVKVDQFRASDGGWVRLVFNTVNGGPLEKVELTKAGTDGWRPLKNAFGAAWEASRLPDFPWDIKLTNAAGKSVVLPEAVTSGVPGDNKSSKNF